MIDQHDHKQGHQVDNGIFECFHGRIGVFAPHQFNRPVQKTTTQYHGAQQVKRAAHPGRKGQQGNQEHDDGVEQDMQLGKCHAVGHRQHGNIHRGVFLAAVDRQRPEMRRRPGKDNQHQQQRVAVNFAGHGGPAQQGRRRTGQAADHNILRRGPLQEHGVNKGIADQ